jgi:hypothetical protein
LLSLLPRRRISLRRNSGNAEERTEHGIFAHAARPGDRLKTFLQSKYYRQNGLGLLFANRRGRPFSANKLREKKLRPLLASQRIPLAGFHAFRHGVATTLILCRFPPFTSYFLFYSFCAAVPETDVPSVEQKQTFVALLSLPTQQ